jgi:hypothetical protein
MRIQIIHHQHQFLRLLIVHSNGFPSLRVIDESGPINRRNPVWGTGRRVWEALTLAAINRALRFTRKDGDYPGSCP